MPPVPSDPKSSYFICPSVGLFLRDSDSLKSSANKDASFEMVNVLIRKFFQPCTENFLKFSRFQYHNFLRTFLAKNASCNVLRMYINGKRKRSTYT